MNTRKLIKGRSLAAVAAVVLFTFSANAQQAGPPQTRVVPGQPSAGQGPTRSIGAQPGGDSDEAPLPEQQRQVGPHAESAGPGVASRSAGGGAGGSRQTIRVVPRPRIIPQGRWQLGVYFDDAPKGLRIRQVVRGSAASRIGLEEGDYLLDVMGYPVGFYGNYYYSLEAVVNRVTPPDGWVNILVWNKRTQAEEAIWVQLDRRGGIVPMTNSRNSAR